VSTPGRAEELANAWLIREIPVVKVLHADSSKRIVLPSPVKPLSAWVPVLVTEKEIRLIAYEPPKKPAFAKGRVVMGKDGWLVWEGEMVMDPVAALDEQAAHQRPGVLRVRTCSGKLTAIASSKVRRVAPWRRASAAR
jgi:hypothetical protein